MRHLEPHEVTSFTMPAEITTLATAVAWYRRNARLAASLPASAPARAKKAYAQRLALARSLVNLHFFLPEC